MADDGVNGELAGLVDPLLHVQNGLGFHALINGVKEALSGDLVGALVVHYRSEGTLNLVVGHLEVLGSQALKTPRESTI